MVWRVEVTGPYWEALPLLTHPLLIYTQVPAAGRTRTVGQLPVVPASMVRWSARKGWSWMKAAMCPLVGWPSASTRSAPARRGWCAELGPSTKSECPRCRAVVIERRAWAQKADLRLGPWAGLQDRAGGSGLPCCQTPSVLEHDWRLN